MVHGKQSWKQICNFLISKLFFLWTSSSYNATLTRKTTKCLVKNESICILAPDTQNLQYSFQPATFITVYITLYSLQWPNKNYLSFCNDNIDYWHSGYYESSWFLFKNIVSETELCKGPHIWAQWIQLVTITGNWD